MARYKKWSSLRGQKFKKVYSFTKKNYRPYIGSAGTRKAPEAYAEGSERLYGPYSMEGLYGRVKTYMRLPDYIRMRINLAWKKQCSKLIGIAIRAIRVGVLVPDWRMGIGCVTDEKGGAQTPNEAEIVEALGAQGLTSENCALMRKKILDEKESRRTKVPYFDYEVYNAGALNPQSRALAAMTNRSIGNNPRAAFETEANKASKRQRTLAGIFVRGVDELINRQANQ